jgi:indole-3-glycerol phosphate synthase
VDLGTTEKLAARLGIGTGVPPRRPEETPGRDARSTALLVAESGIQTRADVERLQNCGAAAILVGESLMKHGDVAAKVRELLG